MARRLVPRRESVTCIDCQRTFSRADHLQRHLLTHSDISAHACPRCQRSFKRKDALSRHLTICQRASPVPIVTPERACYSCATQQVQCDHGIPSCGFCVKIGRLCQYPVQSSNNEVFYATYGQVVTSTFDDQEVVSIGTSLPNDIEPGNVCISPMQNSPVPSTLRGATTPGAPDSECKDLRIDRPLHAHPSLPPATSFYFLIRFTAQYSLAGCFSTSDDAQAFPPVLMSSKYDQGHLTETLDQDSNYWTATPSVCPIRLDEHSYSDSRPQALICDASSPLAANSSSKGIQTLESTAQKSWEICSALRRLNWSKDQDRRCLEFFSPNRIVPLLDLYWSMWHPNWPVIHRPSFSIATTPAPLLAAMMIIGSCHSNLDDARYWFDAVEILAFDTLQFDAGWRGIYHTIQNIQAAYLTCIYQTWDGGEASRMRIQRHRFGDIVTAVRNLNMSSFRHDMTIFTDFENFNWTTFIRQEESIRTLLWVFLLDTAYIIFNNIPPQFALRELSVGLASCEAAFQASSSQECYDRLHSWLSHNPRPTNVTLYGLIKLFFRKQLSEIAIDNLAHESFTNLWCVIGAFHVMLFNMDPSLGGEDQLLTLRSGIDTWERVWSQRLRNNNEHFFDLSVATADVNSTVSGLDSNTGAWRRPGFWKNAAEFWLLAHVILERMALAHESTMAADELSGTSGLHLNVGPHVHDGVAHADMRSLHSFLLAVDMRAY